MWRRDVLMGAALGAVVYIFASRRRGARPRVPGVLGAMLLGLSMSAVFSVTGVSHVSDFHLALRPESINLIPFAGIRVVSHSGFNSYAVRNILGNVLLFLPLGLLVPALFRSWDGFIKVTLLGFFTSLLIECTQLFLARGTDVDDLLLNTLGAMLGCGLYRLARVLPIARSCRDRRLSGALPALLCVLLPYLSAVLLGFWDRAVLLAA